jgi:hypothetical protein
MGVSRPTVRKHLKTVEEPKYQRTTSPSPKLGQFSETLTEWLTLEASLPRARRRDNYPDTGGTHTLFDTHTFNPYMKT